MVGRESAFGGLVRASHSVAAGSVGVFDRGLCGPAARAQGWTPQEIAERVGVSAVDVGALGGV
jgi:hypothetical protein